VVLQWLVLARNAIAKTAAEQGMRIVTGMPLSIQKGSNLDILNTSVDIEGIVLKNPAGFHDTEFVNIPKSWWPTSRGAIFTTGKVHLKQIEFDMKQFTVRAEMNRVFSIWNKLRALQGSQKTLNPKNRRKRPKLPRSHTRSRSIRCALRIGKVVFVDYSGGQPRPRNS